MANLIVDTTYSAEELVTDFFAGSCVQAFNVQLHGSQAAMGFFQGFGTGLNVPAGILITSGNAWNAIGPNDAASAGNSLGSPGDPDLEILAKQSTFDATILQFDFVSDVPELAFRYVFASEEYPEYVCAIFNDVFGFFISGPGIQGPFSSGAANVSRIPGSALPVAINSVNPGKAGAYGNSSHCTAANNGSLNYSHLYDDNNGDDHVQYDGFTVPLDATFTVIPGAVYTARIAVADAGDAIFDSGVFISIESLCGDSLLIPVSAMQSAFTGKYSVALNGSAKYAYGDWVWDMGDGTIITSKDPVNHTYQSPGLYEVRFMASNYCCTDTSTQILPVALPPYLDAEAISWKDCMPNTPGSITLKVLSSVGGLTFHWSDGYSEGPNRTGLAQDLYSVTVTDSEGSTAVFGPFDLRLDPLQVELPQGALHGKKDLVEVRPSGGVAPYDIRWSDGSNAAIRPDLVYGDHYVTVTDQRGCREERFVRLGALALHEGPVIQIQPNPAVGETWVTLRGVGEQVAPGELQVLNALGQLMHRQVLQAETPTALPLSGWPEGIYILHYQSVDHKETRILRVGR